MAYSATPETPSPSEELIAYAATLGITLEQHTAADAIAVNGLVRAKADILRLCDRPDAELAEARHIEERARDARVRHQVKSGQSRHDRERKAAATRRREARKAMTLERRMELALRELAALPAVSAGNIAPDLSADRDHVLPPGGRTEHGYYVKFLELILSAIEREVDAVRYGAGSSETAIQREARWITRYKGVRVAVVAAVERVSTDTIKRARLSHGYDPTRGIPRDELDREAA